jgi:hypothetical protein
MYHRFRGLLVHPDVSEYTVDFENGDFRTVTVLRPMLAPSAATLKKLAYDWNKQDDPAKPPAIPVRWGDEQQNEPSEEVLRHSLVGPKPENPAVGNREASDLAGVDGNIAPKPGGGFVSPPPEPTGGVQETAANKGSAEPAHEPASEEKLAVNVAPARIPDTIPRPVNPDAPENITVFKDEQQAISHKGSGIFGNLGFPLGEYASLIKERVTGNWYIPSNLHNSDEYTTIVFYIDRNGQHFGTRIVDSSGNNSLNITALNAIINSNPFPPLPSGFPGDHIGVKYTFIPELQ